MSEIAEAKLNASTEKPIGTLEEEIEKAERAYALKQYEGSVEHYGNALEIMTSKCGDGAPETADLLFLYGKSLLESAIAQSDVLGKEEETTNDTPALEPSDTRFHFGGDADMEDVAEAEGEEKTVDLFAEAIAAAGKEDEAVGDGEASEDSPEDDFNAAWEVLDLARAIYTKDQTDEGKLKLADTFICLGDISLETEKFDQAITDYSTALQLKTELLPFSSRQLAEVHYKLSIVLDLTPGRLGDAIEHVEKAKASLGARLDVLRLGVGLEMAKDDNKGKGKAVDGNGRMKLPKEDVATMNQEQIQAEIKEVEELQADLTLKVEDLISMKGEGIRESAPDIVARELDAALNGNFTSSVPAPVHDLTSMVKRKKAVQIDGSGSGKRKAEEVEDDTFTGGREKKTKLDNC